MIDMSKNNPITAARIYKRIMRQYCYIQLYDSNRKKRNAHLYKYAKITDEDLMIDFRLDPQVKSDGGLFSLLS
jgi:hypothetical protein